MKVFVYSKKDNHRIDTISDVHEVRREGNEIIIVQCNEEYHFDVKEVKTRIYQN